jgi:hypothetical protein
MPEEQMVRYILAFFVCMMLVASVARAADEHNRWSKAQAGEWYAKQPWLIGCNYIPRTAINQLEMWQALKKVPNDPILGVLMQDTRYFRSWLGAPA